PVDAPAVLAFHAGQEPYRGQPGTLHQAVRAYFIVAPVDVQGAGFGIDAHTVGIRPWEPNWVLSLLPIDPQSAQAVGSVPGCDREGETGAGGRPRGQLALLQPSCLDVGRVRTADQFLEAPA